MTSSAISFIPKVLVLYPKPISHENPSFPTRRGCKEVLTVFPALKLKWGQGASSCCDRVQGRLDVKSSRQEAPLLSLAFVTPPLRLPCPHLASSAAGDAETGTRSQRQEHQGDLTPQGHRLQSHQCYHHHLSRRLRVSRLYRSIHLRQPQ